MIFNPCSRYVELSNSLPPAFPKSVPGLTLSSITSSPTISSRASNPFSAFLSCASNQCARLQIILTYLLTYLLTELRIRTIGPGIPWSPISPLAPGKPWRPGSPDSPFWPMKPCNNNNKETAIKCSVITIKLQNVLKSKLLLTAIGLLPHITRHLTLTLN